MIDEKETAEFQIKEAEVQLMESQESLTAAQEKLAALEKEAEKSNAYQQELEGKILTSNPASL